MSSISDRDFGNPEQNFAKRRKNQKMRPENLSVASSPQSSLGFSRFWGQKKEGIFEPPKIRIYKPEAPEAELKMLANFFRRGKPTKIDKEISSCCTQSTVNVNKLDL